MTDQLDLLTLLDTPGRSRQSNPDTSKRAAKAIKTGALKHRILLHLSSMGLYGANDWELHHVCDPNGRVHSSATRRGELEALGVVTRTSHVRPTDTPGNDGIVHVITDAGKALLASLEAA